MSRVIHLLSALLLFSVAHTAWAIVNMEDLHLAKPQDGFSGGIALSAKGASGNTDKNDYAVGSKLQWHTGKHTDYLLLDYAYGESNKIRNTDKGFLHLRHITQSTPVVAWEAFVQGGYNKFARLSFRGLAGGGLRFTLFNKEDKGAILLGTGAFYSEETLEESTDYTDDGTETLWRGNLYLVLKYAISPSAALLSTTYYQPSLEDEEDYRMTEQAALQVKVTDSISLVMSVDVSRDNKPPQGVKSTDTSYTTSLEYSF